MARVEDQTESLFLKDHLYTMEAFLETEGQHADGAIQVKTSVDFATGDSILSVWCMGCERVWDLRLSSLHLRYTSGNLREAVSKHLAPFMGMICAAPCFRLALEAELAEWLTEKVSRAMPLGITYGQLMDEAVRDHLCAPHDVDVMLDRLGFEGRRGFWVPGEPVHVRLVGSQVVNEGRITLPEGHPAHPGTTPAIFELPED